MEVVRGIGVLALMFGLSALMFRFTGPVRFRDTNPLLNRVVPRLLPVGFAFCGVGGLLMLISLI